MRALENSEVLLPPFVAVAAPEETGTAWLGTNSKETLALVDTLGIWQTKVW